MKKTKVLMVCLGNICRSPTAHGIFQQLVDQRGLSELIEVESAGTSGWHIGMPPDERSQAVALKRGYDLSQQQGRKAVEEDFEEYDFILAMDRENLHNLNVIAPVGYQGHLGLFLEFARNSEFEEVPDPYHGGDAGFELVLDLVEDAAQGLLDHIVEQKGL